MLTIRSGADTAGTPPGLTLNPASAFDPPNLWTTILYLLEGTLVCGSRTASKPTSSPNQKAAGTHRKQIPQRLKFQAALDEPHQAFGGRVVTSTESTGHNEDLKIGWRIGKGVGWTDSLRKLRRHRWVLWGRERRGDRFKAHSDERKRELVLSREQIEGVERSKCVEGLKSGKEQNTN
ncbi:MAG: hypothetical protein MMC23_003460 [Stictis urceolatum]|nr:hypothetical protein [Stictis urceolata]